MSDLFPLLLLRSDLLPFDKDGFDGLDIAFDDFVDVDLDDFVHGGQLH